MPVASCRQGSRYCVPFACRRTPRTATGSRCSDALQGEKSGAGAERARAGSRWSVCVFVKRDDGSVGLTASALPVSVAACMLPEPVGLGQPLSSDALFAWLISHQPAVLFSHNKTATSNQPAVLFSQNKSAPAISHQPTEQAESLLERGIPLCLASQSPHVYQCSPHAGQTQAR
jgi:hypothetical protein